MTKTHELGLNERQALSLLETWAEILTQKETTRAQYTFTPTRNCSVGNTTLSPKRLPECKIGIKNLATFTGKVYDQRFIQAAIALFHEARHAEQDYESKHE